MQTSSALAASPSVEPLSASPAATRGPRRVDPIVAVCIAVLVALVLSALLAPWIAPWIAPADPMATDPGNRLKAPSSAHWLGTDGLGRDIFSRVIHGGRISLAVGLSVALLSTLIGTLIGLVCGYFRWVDAIVMRVIDGLMAIPGILLAIALVSLTKAGLAIVVLAIVVPEVPRVARLVRAVVLAVKSQPFIEAGVAIGTSPVRLMFKHILPNTFAPLTVQATFICASAILIEAYLAFLGVGTPPSTPTWGNIVADGRNFVRISPWVVIGPGLLLGATVLVINVLGDRLRDRLDIRMRSSR